MSRPQLKRDPLGANGDLRIPRPNRLAHLFIATRRLKRATHSHMGKQRVRIGDGFCAQLEIGKRYLQYVANDQTQLNSDVIRVFRTHYPIDANPDLKNVVKDKVDFYAHVFLGFARKLKCWDRVGNVTDVGRVEALFRDSPDYGNPQIQVSHNWWVCRINEPQTPVGELRGANRQAEIGIVISPLS